MKRNSTRTLSTAMLLLLGSAGYASRAAAGPLDEVKALNATLNQLANQGASDARLKQHVNKLLDFELLARNTLRDHWSARTSAELAEFKTTFRALIEKNYIAGIRKNAKYTIQYQRESVSGASAIVYTLVKHTRKGRPQESDVKYKMRRGGGRWIVHDVVTDDVSMETNYRNSFNRIIKDKGFAELIAKMKKKLASSTTGAP